MTSRLILLALLCPLAAASSWAQTPRDRPQAAGVGTGRIAGRVVSVETEPKPLRRARVTLNGSALQTGRTAITSDDGSFAFDGLPPGQYTLAAVKSGYITTAYGATRAGRPGLPVTITPGVQQMITIAVPRGSVITGMLTDSNGQPLPGLQVRALTYLITPPAGDRELVPIPGTPILTDDRGVYRIFGLPAGEYAVVVRPRPGLEAHSAGLRTVTAADVKQALAEVRQSRDRRTLPVPSPKPPGPSEPAVRVAFAPVFYPGTTTVAQARLITLSAGEERRSVDFQIDYVPVARVAGSVIMSAGATRADVSLVPDTRESLLDEPRNRRTTTDGDGLFAFDHVPPGRYMLVAGANSAESMRSASAVSVWAVTEILVDGQDIPNVTLTLLPGLTIEGRLMFEGRRSPTRLGGFQGIGLPLWSRGAHGRPVALISPDGEFTIQGMAPGRYQPIIAPGIRTPIGPWWLKSIQIDGREVLDAPLDIRTSTKNVTVTFGDSVSELNGRVVDARGVPATNLRVIVFPASSGSWFFNSRRIAAVPLDVQGRYTIRNLPAGDYLIVAGNDLDDFQWFDPDTLQQLVPLAARITIGENEKVTHDITVPAR